jgi:serine/threonine protein kinase
MSLYQNVDDNELEPLIDIILKYVPILNDGSENYWDGSNNPWKGYRYIKNLGPYGFENTILAENVEKKYIVMLKIMKDSIEKNNIDLQINYPGILHENKMGLLFNSIMKEDLSPGFTSTGNSISIPIYEIESFPSENSLWTRFREEFSNFYEEYKLYEGDLLDQELDSFFKFFVAKYISLLNERMNNEDVNEFATNIKKEYEEGNFDNMFSRLKNNFPYDEKINATKKLLDKKEFSKLVYSYAPKKFFYEPSERPSIIFLELEVLTDVRMSNIVTKGGISEYDLKCIVLQLLNILGAMKIKNIIHRGITADDILLPKRRLNVAKKKDFNKDEYAIASSNDYYHFKPKYRPVIFNFERSEFMRFSNDIQEIEKPVTKVMSRAPETFFLIKTPILNNNSSDVFSMGLAIVDMITVQIEDLNRNELYNNIRNEDFFNVLSKEYVDFCEEKERLDVSIQFLCEDKELLLLHIISLIYLLGWPTNRDYDNIENTNLWKGLYTYLPSWLTDDNMEGFLFTNEKIIEGAGDEHFVELLKSMLSWDPSNRLDPLIINHPYFNNLRSNELIYNDDTYTFGWKVEISSSSPFPDFPAEGEEIKKGKRVGFTLPKKSKKKVLDYIIATNLKRKKYKIKSLPKQKIDIIGKDMCQCCNKNKIKYISNITPTKKIYVCSQICIDNLWSKLK